MNSAKKVNVFLAHTPLQNFIAAKTVAQFYQTEEYRNIIYTSVEMLDEKPFDEYTFIDKNSFLNKIINTYRAKKKIEKVITKESSIFIAHTSALLDNYFFYSFPLAKYNIKLNFYYEGVLYFYEYHQNTNNKELFKRKLYGFLCNIYYQANSLIFPFNDKKINKIYSILPEFTLGPRDKISKISILKEGYKSKENTILIMGGKPSLLENTEVISIYSEMIKLIKFINNPVKIYFKGHHADTSNNFELANNNQIEVVDITQNSPIEEVIELYSPSLVLSYPSSGLINLKAMYGSKINMVSYYVGEKKNDIKKLVPIFSKLNIELKFI